MPLLTNGDFMYLKKEESKVFPDVILFELNGLNRYNYVEYIAEQESLTLQQNEDVTESELRKLFFKMELNLNSYMIALSFSNSDEYKGQEVQDIQKDVLQKFGLDSMRSMCMQIRELSGMVIKTDENNHDSAEEEQEKQTAEKS